MLLKMQKEAGKVSVRFNLWWQKKRFNGHKADQEPFCIKGVAVIFFLSVIALKLDCFSRLQIF